MDTEIDADRYSALQAGMAEFNYELHIIGRLVRVKGTGPRRGFSSKSSYKTAKAALAGEEATLAAMRADRDGLLS